MISPGTTAWRTGWTWLIVLLVVFFGWPAAAAQTSSGAGAKPTFNVPPPPAEALAKNQDHYVPFSWRKGLKEEYRAVSELVKKNPDDAAAHFELAAACGYTGKLEEGWAELVKTNEMDPNFKNTGTAKFEQLVREDPADWKYKFRLAFGYFFLDRKEDSIKQFEQILDMYPDHIWAMNYMAYVWVELGKPERALALWELSNKIDANVPATHFVLGQAYLRTNRYWKATEEIATAFKLRALGYW